LGGVVSGILTGRFGTESTERETQFITAYPPRKKCHEAQEVKKELTQWGQTAKPKEGKGASCNAK